MAQKRMFDKSIIETDEFLDMGMATKALYFLLGMEADDEGFVSPKRVMRLYGGNDDDLKVLKAKGFVIQFESGVVVITDWKENNYLDKNRIKETRYKAEKELLALNNNKYTLLNNRLTNVQPEEYRREEKSIEEKRIAKTKVSAPLIKQDSEMQLQGFIDWCNKSPHRYIKLIGEWADTIKPSFSMKSQWEVYLKRNLRAAKELAVFDDNQIQTAFYAIEADIKGGLTYQPAIETLLKKLTK